MNFNKVCNEGAKKVNGIIEFQTLTAIIKNRLVTEKEAYRLANVNTEINLTFLPRLPQGRNPPDKALY